MRRPPTGRAGVVTSLVAASVAAVLASLTVAVVVADRDRDGERDQLADWATVTGALLQRRLELDVERLESLIPVDGDPAEGLTADEWWDGVARVADRARAGQWRAVMLVRPGTSGWYDVDVPGPGGPHTAAVARISVWDSTPLLEDHRLPDALGHALARARDLGRPQLSGAWSSAPASIAPVPLPGAALVVPLFDQDLPVRRDVPALRTHLVGWLVADVVVGSLLGESLRTAPDGATARILDEGGQLLAGAEEVPEGRLLRVSLPLVLGGLPVTLAVSRPDPVPLLATAPLTSGLGITVMLLLLAAARVRAETRARRLVRDRTRALSARTQELEVITDGSPDLMLRVDGAGRVLFANPVARRVTGLEPAPAGGDLRRARLDADTATRLLDAVHAAGSAGAAQTLDVSAGTAQARREYEVRVVPVAAPGSPSGRPEVLVVGRDVTDRRRAERALAHRALHDPLTGLGNLTLVQERLSALLDAAAVHGAVTVVLLLDLDRFKLVNDSLGHAVGNDLLAQIARRLRCEATREQDTVGRLGGDEFVVVAQIAEVSGAPALARQLLAAFDRPFRLGGAHFTFSASVGVALADGTEATGEELISRADSAMYRAKARGGNEFCVYDPAVTDSALGRLLRAEELRAALAAGELFLAYQPEVDLRDDAVGGVEALVRWRHPRLGVLGPAAFLPVAEETGLIVPLGQWVLDQAVREAVQHNRDASRPVRVWVNISARQLLLCDLGSEVREVLRAHGAEPQWLGIEVTESAFLGDDVRVEHTLQELRLDGVQVAVDDFGTGWSSLSRLQELPVDVLKVDQAFVRGLHEPGGARVEHIVRAIVAMGRALSATVVAEGIQTQRQLDDVLSLGCDVGQGYLLSRPTTWAEAVAARDGATTERQRP